MDKYNYITMLNGSTKSVSSKLWKVPKHFPPASNEWKTAVFSYNKINSRDAAGLDSIADYICRSYFNLYYVADKKMKSRRMRELIRKLSTKRAFVSKPELKHTSDQVSVTSYVYDRESVFHKRKLFFVIRQFNRLNLFFSKLYIKKSRRRKIKRAFRRFSRIRVVKQDLKKYQNLKRFFFSSDDVEMNFMKWLSQYYFFKWALSLFRIKLKATSILSMVKNERGLLQEKVTGLTISISKSVHCIKYNFDLIEFDDTIRKNITTMLYKLLLHYLISTKPNSLHKGELYEYLGHIYWVNLNNKSLTGITEKQFSKKDNKNLLNINSIKLVLNIELLLAKYLHKIYCDYYFKYDYLIPGLKTLLRKIYDKKVNINIVRLKYLYLNSDIMSDAIVTKLRKKTGRILRVLRKSLSVAKLPKLNIKDVIVRNKNDNPYTAVKEKESLATLTRVPNFITNIKKTFNTIKYKWLTGIRVEGKGRLTKRFTASRALFKYKHKGSLRNIEYINYVTPNMRTQSIYLLRGEHRPNLQHSFAHSNKRIGAYGIKTWLSSN